MLAGFTSPFPSFCLLPIWFELFVWQWLSLGSGWCALDSRRRRNRPLHRPFSSFEAAASSFAGATPPGLLTDWTSPLALLLGLGGGVAQSFLRHFRAGPLHGFPAGGGNQSSPRGRGRLHPQLLRRERASASPRPPLPGHGISSTGAGHPPPGCRAPARAAPARGVSAAGGGRTPARVGREAWRSVRGEGTGASRLTARRNSRRARGRSACAAPARVRRKVWPRAAAGGPAHAPFSPPRLPGRPWLARVRPPLRNSRRRHGRVGFRL